MKRKFDLTFKNLSFQLSQDLNNFDESSTKTMQERRSPEGEAKTSLPKNSRRIDSNSCRTSLN